MSGLFRSRQRSWIILCFFLISIAAPLAAPYDPDAQADLRTSRLVVPLGSGFLRNDSSEMQTSGSGAISTLSGRFKPHNAMFLLGTDNLGRDVLSRLLYALRISLLIGMGAMVLSLFAGVVIGIAAGMSRNGLLDHLLMRIVDLFLSIPAIFLVIVIVAFFGNSVTLLILVLAGTGWMSVARLVRGEVLHLRDREFVLAARMLGCPDWRIILDHILPNILPTVVVSSALQLGNVVLAEASLSFLGLGVQPPTPSLGNMIGESLAYFDRGWWVGIFPGIVLTLIVFLTNRFAEYIKEQSEAGSIPPGGAEI
ncbi:MAG TPA: ABC transporter permease [Bacteroidota bacterium]|nr:ABC transporter permease [Bacteroidota bacterium]